MHQTGLQHEGACVPSNLIKAIIKQLDISGKVERPYIGMSFKMVPGGLAVVKVKEGSPAFRSGV